MQNPKYQIPDLESSWIFNLEGISGELLLLLPMEGWMLRWASESIPAQEKSTSGMLAIGRSTYGRSTSGRQGPASTWYSTRTRNFLSYSNSTRTKHYSDRVVSSINSRNFTIISTIIQKQPAMEKIFQDNYSKSWYSKVVVHGKDERWFAC